MQTREQRRMQLTWDRLTQADRFGDNPDAWKDRLEAQAYLNAVKKTPARIHTSRLGQALAFLRSRGRRGNDSPVHEWVYQDISDLVLDILDMERTPGLLDCLREKDLAFLFLATEEAMAVCGWLSDYLSGYKVKQKQDDSN